MSVETMAADQPVRIGDLSLSLPAASGVTATFDRHPRRHGAWATWTPPSGAWAYGAELSSAQPMPRGARLVLGQHGQLFVASIGHEPGRAIATDTACQERAALAKPVVREILDGGLQLIEGRLGSLIAPPASARFLGRAFALRREATDFKTISGQNLGRRVTLRVALTPDVTLDARFYETELPYAELPKALGVLEHLLTGMLTPTGKAWPEPADLDALCVAQKP